MERENENYGDSLGRNTSPDYRSPGNWLLREIKGKKDADTLFLCPTISFYSYEDNGIVGLSEPEREKAARVYQRSGRAFEEHCNMYVPYYRQFCLNKMMECSRGGNRELLRTLYGTVVKDDVYSALDAFFALRDPEKPFFLAGHSLGAGMLRMALADYFPVHPGLLNNLVAAYLVGFGIPRTYFSGHPELKFAEGETDTGCVISWNTEGFDATLDSVLVSEGDCMVINPVSWSRNGEYCPKERSKGALVEGMLIPGFADAQCNCSRGVVMTHASDHYLALEPFGDRCLHLLDYSLYFGDITYNAGKRIEAFYSRKGR